MHQHPRRAPTTSSPANSPSTNPTRTNNPRERDKPSPRVGSYRDVFIEQPYGPRESDDSLLQAPELSDAEKAEINKGKLNQIVQMFFARVALVVLHARVALAPAFNRDNQLRNPTNWFALQLPETDSLRDYVRTWRTCDAVDARPPPMIIETFLNVQDSTSSQSLVFIDDNGKRWDVEEALEASSSSAGGLDEAARPEVILERWVIQIGGPAPGKSPEEYPLARLYKSCVLMFRSLFTLTKVIPAWRISKKLLASRTSTNTPKLRFRISQDLSLGQRSQRDTLTIPLCPNQRDLIDQFAFDPIHTPAGPLSVHVTYRTSCDFAFADSEALLSSRFMGMDEPFQTRPVARRQESAPTRRQYMGSEDTYDRRKQNRPSLADQGQAYGSMSTFHQTGPPAGTSPLSALRAARIAGSESPEDSALRKERPSTRSSQGSRSSLRSDAAPRADRRPSVSFTPFKTPSLSASPSQAEPVLGSLPRGSSVGKSSPLAVLAEARHPSGPIPQRGSPKATEHSRTPSQNSPKPPAPQRFSSSFGHRKAKLSTGGSKTEDDASSGKASASSSAAAQPGSGVLAEGGNSSGSLQTDDDNISDFLKMLDQKKDLRSFRPNQQHAPSEASSRRTVAALSKFQRMRDANAALSESMSSSLMLHRSSSSSSRQLASVPPMIAGTSISTSSSPGKPISPHTPHTPAIPSRLSAQYPTSSTSEQTHEMTAPEQEEPQEPEEPAPRGAINIPSSPRIRQPSYRRSSSARQGHRNLPLDDEDEIFPFAMRSASLGFDDRPPPSRSALVGLQCDVNKDECAVGNPSVDNRPTFGPPLSLPEHESPSMERQRSSDGQESSGPYSRRGYPYRPQVGRGRGDIGPQESSSSLMERGSHSGSSDQRGGRYSFSRPTSAVEDEETLPFAFESGEQSRRSRENLRGGLHSGGDSAGSSRRGSRRGGN